MFFNIVNDNMYEIDMLPNFIIKKIKQDDSIITNKGDFSVPPYNPITYYKDISSSNYFHSLLILRHYIKIASDYYFGFKVGAKNIDLFMLTPSISSPIGPGSDSEAIKIKFGKLNTFLIDSSQFGFEPILLNDFKKVYCYLPSMRGEKPDSRHLNQFFHCEVEIIGTLDDLFRIAEGYVKFLCETVLLMENIVDNISNDEKKTKTILNKTIKIKTFPKITFDEAVDILCKHGMKKYINFTKKGRDISSKGEIELMKILNVDTPIWITYFDRDRVPFYQKPLSTNKEKTTNADLLFPPLLINNSFGGEILGSGQRQDNPKEMYESLKRQNISTKPYEWYIDTRRNNNYKITSGFGLGIERFLAWALAKESIRDVIPYPRLKNIKTLP